MTKDELIQSNARRIEKNRVFEGILTNPDFIAWQEAGPLAEMKLIQHEIVTIDRNDPLWKEKVAEGVIAYQAISRVIMGTVIKANEARESRKALKELDTK
jgi:hypothetical protein